MIQVGRLEEASFARTETAECSENCLNADDIAQGCPDMNARDMRPRARMPHGSKKSLLCSLLCFAFCYSATSDGATMRRSITGRIMARVLIKAQKPRTR